jgi:hypothetical protein
MLWHIISIFLYFKANGLENCHGALLISRSLGQMLHLLGIQCSKWAAPSGKYSDLLYFFCCIKWLGHILLIYSLHLPNGLVISLNDTLHYK